jgi:hypothetical protein
MPDFSNGKPSVRGAAGRALPFHDEEDDSDEERGFMKPFSDNPNAKAYSDEG